MNLHTLPAYAPVAAATLILPRSWTGRASRTLAPPLGRRLHPAGDPRLLANYGRFLADFMHAAWRGPRGIAALVPRVYGLEAAGEASRAGRGVLFVSVHLGQWELGGFRIGERGFPFLSVAERRGSEGMQRLRAWARRRFGGETLHVNGYGADRDAFRSLSARLRDGGRAGMLIDARDPRTGAIAFSRAPALLQRRTGCAIVPFVCLLDDDGRYTLTLLDPVMPGADAGGCLEETLRQWIARYPDQHYLFPTAPH